eukprot:376513-Alexandrium_andersonii.AAC.1
MCAWTPSEVQGEIPIAEYQQLGLVGLQVGRRAGMSVMSGTLVPRLHCLRRRGLRLALRFWGDRGLLCLAEQAEMLAQTW